MYVAYQDLLDVLAKKMKWRDHKLAVGEDLSYGNLVACASAKWITEKDPARPEMPPMTAAEKTGIVNECFFKQKHFVKQLLQSLPKIILIFSQTTANAFISTFKNSFIDGNPLVNEPIEKLLDRKITVSLGKLPNNDTAAARVIFAPHITGDPGRFKTLKKKLIAQLVQEAEQGHIQLNDQTLHLKRTPGACSFCPSFDIGKCDYEDELQFLINGEHIYPGQSPHLFKQDKIQQVKMLDEYKGLNFTPSDWNAVD